MTSVIVVDDDKDLAQTTSDILEMSDIEVSGIGFDGEEAYQLYEKHKPDVVILDMKMPNYDGGYALEKIKEYHPDAKIIVVTGYTDYKFDKAKADAIFSKPCSIDSLIEKIKELKSVTVNAK